jgi:hypothetical protein
VPYTRHTSPITFSHARFMPTLGPCPADHAQSRGTVDGNKRPMASLREPLTCCEDDRITVSRMILRMLLCFTVEVVEDHFSFRSRGDQHAKQYGGTICQPVKGLAASRDSCYLLPSYLYVEKLEPPRHTTSSTYSKPLHTRNHYILETTDDIRVRLIYSTVAQGRPGILQDAAGQQFGKAENTSRLW